MPYPIITKPDAVQWYLNIQQEASQVHTVRTSSSSTNHFLNGNVSEIDKSLILQILALRTSFQTADGKFPQSTNFEFELGKIIFTAFQNTSKIILTDASFWRWFTISMPELLEVVAWRHNKTIETVNQVQKSNLGIGNIREGLFSRCWLRVALAYDENARNQFLLAQQGDQDFWRSHILRQSYAKSPAMVRALIRFQYPQLDNQAKLTPSGNNPLGIRDLARNLSALLSTIAIDTLDDEEAYEFIQETYNRMELSHSIIEQL